MPPKKKRAKPPKKKSAKKKRKKKTGRPKLTWTPAQLKTVEEVAGNGATPREIADYLGCAKQTIYNRIDSGEDVEFLDAYKKGRAKFKIDIRKNQADIMRGSKRAVPGQATMLVWLGKNELGQKDSSEIEIVDESRKDTLVFYEENPDGSVSRTELDAASFDGTW